MRHFRDGTVCQVYTKSFQDTTGNGLGDICGVVSRLDYLKGLGIDYIWLTPFFSSPLNDSGYDVADYRTVDPVFGTMKDMKGLTRETDMRGMEYMFDIVLNHTSTKHPQLKKTPEGNPEYMDYYISREESPDAPPTNWQSKLGGNTWEYIPRLKKWYPYLFDVTQVDLDQGNPRACQELKEIILFWKAKRMKGLRFDVVNLISKPDIFEDDHKGDGRRFYTDGSGVHEHLQKLVRDTDIESMVTVREIFSTTLDGCIRYSRPEDRELSMCFNLHHPKVDYRDGDKWKLTEPDLVRLKQLFMEWQEGMKQENGWNAVFWCNHNQPRAISRFGDDGRYWKESAEVLATVIHIFRGTPYMCQGEELGITNPRYGDISQYRGVKSINYHHILTEQGITREEALKVLVAHPRDNGWTPMQWDDSRYAGFSQGEPWIGIPKNHSCINAQAEAVDSGSILNYYKGLIALRKEYKVISKGEIEFIYREHPQVLAYRRTYQDRELVMLANMKASTTNLGEKPELEGRRRLIGNYGETDCGQTLEQLKSCECKVCIRTL